MNEPNEHYAGTAAPKANGPSCPWCGGHGTSVAVGSAHGQYLCSCGSLHDGSDAEWRRLAEHRKHAIARRTGGGK